MGKDRHSMQGFPGKGGRNPLTPLGAGSWALPCVLELLGPLASHPQGSSFSSAFNSWLWEYWWSLTDPRTHRFGLECYSNGSEEKHSRIPVSILTSQSEEKRCAPGFNCHRMATLYTCFSTYLLVSNLITIQSRGKTLIFIRFRNTQKIFRRNSCHTQKRN